jgi:hypothetical protein
MWTMFDEAVSGFEVAPGPTRASTGQPRCFHSFQMYDFVCRLREVWQLCVAAQRTDQCEGRMALCPAVGEHPPHGGAGAHSDGCCL